MRKLPFIFLLMTTLSLTSGITYAQSKQLKHLVRAKSLLESRKQRIMTILPASSFDYLFPLKHKSFDYSTLVDTLAAKQQFCGQQLTKTLTDESCRQWVAEFLTELSYQTANRDPYLGVEIWRQGLYFPVVTIAEIAEQLSQKQSQEAVLAESIDEYLMFAAFLDVPIDMQNVVLGWQQADVHAKVFSPYK